MKKYGKNILSILFLLFIPVKLGNYYISLEFNDVDDCVHSIEISNNTIWEFNDPTIDLCDYEYRNTSHPKFFVKNYKLDLNVEILFKFQDSTHYAGFMDINVYFNEYIIKISDQKFWKCSDCGGKDNAHSSEGEGMIILIIMIE